MADDYVSQLTGDSSGLNGILSANSLESDAAPKKVKAGTDKDFHEGVAKAIGTVEESQKELQNLPKLKPPELTKPPNPADFQTDPMQKLGSAGSMIAALGSLLTRKHITNAFNNMAEVNKSIDAGDASKFKSAYDEWKVNNENTMKVADWNQKNLEDLSRRLKDREAGAEEEAGLYAVATENPSLANAVKTGQIQKYIDDHKAWTMDYNDAQETVKLKHEFIKAGLDEAEAKKGSPLTQPEVADISVARKKEFDAKPVAATGGSTMPTEEYNAWKTDPHNIKLADAYADGVAPPELVKGIGKEGAKKLDSIQKLATERHPDLDIAQVQLEYGLKKHEMTALGTQETKIKLADNMLKESLPSMMDVAKKVGLSTSTDLNSLYNAAKRHLSNQEFSNFSTQLRAVTSDYAQFIGRGRLTVHSDEEALRILNDNMGISALQGFVDAVNTERNNVEKAMKDSENDISGRKTSSGNEAPEGTVIHNGDVTKVKKDGKWVVQ